MRCVTLKLMSFDVNIHTVSRVRVTSHVHSHALITQRTDYDNTLLVTL